MEAFDIRLDEDGDLYINPNTGDLEVSASDKQHIKDIIESNVGWWKQFPLVGVGVLYYLNSPGKIQQLEREIKIQLTADGYSADRPTINMNNNGNFTISPNAIRL